MNQEAWINSKAANNILESSWTLNVWINCFSLALFWRQLLQVFTIYFKFITKCDKCYYKVRQLFLLQSAMVCYYKVRQLFYYKVRQVLLQSATVITKCDNFITKCDRYYKVRRLLQSATVQRFWGTYTYGDEYVVHAQYIYFCTNFTFDFSWVLQCMITSWQQGEEEFEQKIKWNENM